jgi:hypothetical protein
MFVAFIGKCIGELFGTAQIYLRRNVMLNNIDSEGRSGQRMHLPEYALNKSISIHPSSNQRADPVHEAEKQSLVV